MNRIHPEMTIGELLTKYPEVLPVFSANGFPAATRDELLALLSPQLLLKSALALKGYNGRVFTGLLEEKITEHQAMLKLQAAEPVGKTVDFLGYTYCPIKHIFKECFEQALEKYLAQTQDDAFTYFVPSGCTGEDDPYAGIWEVEDIDDFPDVVAAGGYGDFFRQKFVDRFVSKGYFRSVGRMEVHEYFANTGCEDPQGHYGVYAAMPIVMLVDRRKLGDLPMPSRWSDLLDPVYHNNIIIGGAPDDIYEDILFFTYKDHGEAGLVKLAANVKTALHGAQMAKLAGTANSQGAAVYVIPLLFAKACPRTAATQLVWPEDGALITPLYLLVKAAPRRNLQLFIDFVTGVEYGQKSADNGFPVLNSAVDNKLPAQAAFKWLGWDFIRAQPLEQLYERVMTIFTKAWRKPGTP
ncbi:ABC-type Fe3+ transport system, substrate-binding protein [Dendrosporobacter quercicolus]|uniref:ABC-type Fe3+ transport system, substrate-binding protein n=1 Tax=Dendrosporobacter quercicolus TaxID=146817 RepID=A0A1G9RJQ4_9FIRM|nr:ABC transporter substrate-binding protein [Dendrosporobacter quercicolus]SDM23448.1 ABC-type Fe3+ transport system, substrate-binding protein [Dendrosporobacter quercicolus]